MASRERTTFQAYHLTPRANSNAPYKPPRPKMPLPGAGSGKSAGKAKSSQIKIDSENEDEITALPLSSDDEDDNSADIKPTEFAPKKIDGKGDNEVRTRRNRSKNGTNESLITITESPSNPNLPKVGQGMRKSQDFTGVKSYGWSGPTQKKSRALYGANSKANSKAGGDRNSRVGKTFKRESPETNYQDVELLEPEDKSSPIEKFKTIEYDDLDTPQKESKFYSIDVGDLGSPPLPSFLSKAKTKANLKREKVESDDEDLSGFKIPEGIDGSFGDVLQDTPVRVNLSPSSTEDAKRRKLDHEPLLDEVSDYVKNMVKEDGYDDLLNHINIDTHPASSPGSSKYLAELDNDWKTKSQPICPVCMESVDPKILESWGEMKGFNRQSKFCRYHQKKTAEAEWSDKGYPTIDWQGMDERTCDHHKFIKKLIKGAPCHYRTVLDDAIKSGKNRTLKDMSMSLVPGYYGSRGLKLISENIMNRFAKLLKEQAVKDRLIAARGVPSFVQAVLVLEVGCNFIMEDMGIDEDDARDVLTESIAIGELVNEEVKDVVKRRHESDED